MNKNNLKRNLVITGISFTAFGGVEKVALELNSKLKNSGVNSFILVSKTVKKHLEMSYSIEYVKENFLFYNDAKGDSFLLQNINILRFVKKEFGHNTNIISFWYTFNIVLSLLSKFFNLNIIAVEHSDYYYCPKKWQLIRSFSYKMSKCIVALNIADAKKYKLINPNTYVIPNFTPFEHQNAAKEKFIKTNTIIYAGHFRALKRLDLLIYAVEKNKCLLEKNNWEVLLIGDGSESSKIANLVKEKCLQNIVKFVGFQRDLKPYYKTAKIITLMSDFECLPMVVIESKSYSIIPICSIYSEGVHDLVINSKTGFLFEKGSKEGLSNTLSSVLNAPSEQLNFIAVNVNKDSKRFASDLIIDKWLKIIL